MTVAVSDAVYISKIVAWLHIFDIIDSREGSPAPMTMRLAQKMMQLRHAAVAEGLPDEDVDILMEAGFFTIAQINTLTPYLIKGLGLNSRFRRKIQSCGRKTLQRCEPSKPSHYSHSFSRTNSTTPGAAASLLLLLYILFVLIMLQVRSIMSSHEMNIE